MLDCSRVYKKDKIILHFAIEKCLEKAEYKLTFNLEDEYLKTKEEKNKEKEGTIQFKESFPYEYDFSKIQKIKFTLERWRGTKYKSMQRTENSFYTLSSIISSKNSIFKTRASNFQRDNEIIVISAENPNYSENNHIKNFNFVDYIKAGIIFDGYICIDFSGGKQHNDNLEENQYLLAIQGFTDTLKDYIQKYNVFGYGAKSINNSENYDGNKCFHLNMGANPEIEGFDNIRLKYKDSLYKMNSEKKGYLSHAYEKMRKLMMMKYSDNKYNILFILINNLPSEDDLDKCIDYLLDFSHLPISIVTILMEDKSEEEIKNIKYYFSNKRTVSKSGNTRARNNVCFYSMKNCNFNPEILKNKCLREIPEQVLEYFRLNKKKPSNFGEVLSYKQINKDNNNINNNINNQINNNIINNINENNINFENNIIKINNKKDKIENASIDENCAPNPWDQINININNDKEDFKEKKEYKENKDNYIEDEKDKNIKLYKNTPGNDNNNEKKYNNYNNININFNNNNINHINPFKQNINLFEKKDFINDTPDPDKFDKPHKPDLSKKIINPFKKKESNNQDEIKEDIKEEKKYISDININININNNKIINNDKPYVNETDDGNRNNNNINKFKINNPYKKKSEEKIYKNTPNPDEITPFEENKMKIDNPFKSHKNQLDHNGNDKVYVNETPGKDNIKIPKFNPFQKRNIDININKMDDIKEDKKDETKVSKIGAHFKRKDINLSKFSTKSSNNEIANKQENDDYSIDN